ncbi:MAG: sensor histidine kinase [Planctomycetia bacterium]
MVFWVADNGPGVRPGALGRPFIESDAADLSSGKGSRRTAGLGLNIVRRIVDRHGGRVWLQSAKPHGAVFYVHLPGRFEAMKDTPP